MPDNVSLSRLELRGESILAAVKASGVAVAVSLPDLWTSDGLLRRIAVDPDLRHVRVCKEDEGFGICSGLAMTGHRAALFMQCTGLLDSINALRVAVELTQPTCMIVGLILKESGRAPRESDQIAVRIVEPILDAMGVPHHLLETAPDIACIGPAIERAYATSHPVAFLVGPRLKG